MTAFSSGVWVRLLGPVEVWENGRRVPLGPPRERCVLAALAADAGRAVPVDTLIDRVWGEESPLRVRHALYVYVARMRQRLAGSPAVPHRAGGYVLDVDPECVDVHRFRGLLGRAGESGRSADERLVLLREAVGLWEGVPLADVSSPWVEQTRDVWRQEHLDAVVVWATAELAAGNAASTVSPLTELAGQHPLAESVVAVLMAALHSTGRSADALDWYRRCRDHLVAELGVEPGPRLRDAHRMVLRGEQTPVAAAPAPVPLAVRPAQLPLDIAGFAGRTAELARLDGLLAVVDRQPTAAVVAVLWGTAGVGKTALAVRWAHLVRDRFPDGQLYVNLRGFEPTGAALSPGEAVRYFLDGLGVTPQRVPAGLDAQIGLFRSLLDGRRMLVLLDNARDAEQVRPLLPSAAGCLAIVTSRGQLTSLVAVEGAIGVPLDLLDVGEAHDLLARRIGADRIEAEPDVVDAIVTACARLPLALAVVAARAATQPALPLAELATQLRDSALDTLTAGDARTTVQTAFSWSYRTLTAEAARVFRLLGLHPGPDIAIEATASLAGTSVAEARVLMAELADANLLTEHEAGRWTCHDLLRAFARDLVGRHESEQARHDAVLRMLDHYLHTADGAATRLNPHRAPINPAPPAAAVTVELPADAATARQWHRAEHAVLCGMVPAAARAGFDTHAWQLARSMTTYLNHRGLWSEMADLHTMGLAAARRIGDRDGQVHTLRDLGLAHTRRAEHDEAERCYTEAVTISAEKGDTRQWAHAHVDLAELMGLRSRFRDAIQHLELAATAEDRLSRQGNIAGMFGWCYAQLGEYQEGLRHCRRALDLSQQAGDRWSVASNWDDLGYIHHQLGAYDEAKSCYTKALTIVREVGDLYREAETLDHITETHVALGDTAAARATRDRARTIRETFDAS